MASTTSSSTDWSTLEYKTYADLQRNLQSKETIEKSVGIIHNAFFHSFAKHYPNLKVIKTKADVKRFDLIIFPGGEDINPKRYGQINMGSSFYDERDDIEFPLAEEALKKDKKILAVCRGHQLASVLLGNTLVQDIQHHPSFHRLTFMRDTPILAKFFKNKVINSYHHQGVKTERANYPVSCYNGDTDEHIVEGFETKNIISVQFHPEFQDGNEEFFKYLINRW
jgi:putative glutamine amidotransferase